MAPQQPSRPEDGPYDGGYARTGQPHPQQPPPYDPHATGHPGYPSAEDDAGGIRAAERSAERAAAVAAVEGFHPLRLRPYVVAEPDGEAGESTVRQLIDTDQPGAYGDPYDGAPGPADGGPAFADLGLFPAAGQGHGDLADDDEDTDLHAASAAHGRHRRRRRGIVVAAAAVAASALAAGAVAVSGHIGTEQPGTDRALPDQSSSMPDVVLPSDATQATASTAPAMTGHTTAAATPRTATPSATPSTSATADPAGTAPSATGAAPTEQVSGSAANATAATPPSASDGSTTTATTGTSGTSTPTDTASDGSGTTTTPASATTQVLQVGDTGPAVTDLQRRLSKVWCYAGPIDGVFDNQVKLAVATFQTWYWVSDAPDGSHNGIYGPHTRAALQHQTPSE
ncbi:peptidoglycan-binding domain-containing protein [Actinacidiphila sp. bgisy144]|uniref:peptidoglycan-binding domain-containing protein n=1 Tax=Actinacidiphila sp. bgisy144 TaxID=3413791 RepID=UPI003EB9D353